MFKTYVGALQDEDAAAYLRPETPKASSSTSKMCVTLRGFECLSASPKSEAFRNEVTHELHFPFPGI